MKMLGKMLSCQRQTRTFLRSSSCWRRFSVIAGAGNSSYPSLRHVIPSWNVRTRESLLNFRRRSSSTGIPGNESVLPHAIGSFNSVLIRTRQLPETSNVTEFEIGLRDSLRTWRSAAHKAVWLHVDLEHGHLLQAAADMGFQLHHASGGEVVMTCWLCEEDHSRIPAYASHQVGVCGCVLRPDTNEILVTKDKYKLPIWKFPGGLSDDAEDIADTAVREVKEETGIDAEFKSILAFRQQHHQPNTFDRSDLYVICRLEAQSHDISMCEHEVLQCRWMSLQDLATVPDTTALSRRMAALLFQGLRDGFDSVDIGMSQFDSVYPGLTYKLFHRPLLDKLEKQSKKAKLDSIAAEYEL